MITKSIRITVALLCGLLIVAAPVLSDERGDLVKELWIGGQAYQVELTSSHINQVIGSGDSRHYKGHFPEDPNSWVRVTRMGDGWEGLAFAFNELHTIRSGGDHNRVTSFSFGPDQTPQCGLDHLHADASITPDSLASTAMAQAVSANYDTLCDDRVDGACLMLELELAFDLQFQNRFSDHESRAGAILNMVEGFYQAQFGIIFDTLTLEFLDTEVFSQSTDSSAVLNDIASKRENNQLSFLKSSRSLFHLVTGHSFEGNVAGIAYVGSVCGFGPSATGVSSGDRSSVATAVVVAHELGHNLGALHDSASGLGNPDSGFFIEGNNCPTDRSIMSPSVRSSYDSFSSCSKNYITSKISSLNAVEQCFNFPADAGISAPESNPTEVEQGQIFHSVFDVAYSAASQPADGLLVEGSIGEDEGFLREVTLNGADCSLLSQTRFSCPEAQAQSSLILSVQATAAASPSVNLVKGVALVSDSGDVKDILSDNDTLLTRIAVTESAGPVPEEPQEPDGQPRDSGDSGSDSTGSSSSGSGGGGSPGWFWLLAGMVGVARFSWRAI